MKNKRGLFAAVLIVSGPAMLLAQDRVVPAPLDAPAYSSATGLGARPWETAVSTPGVDTGSSTDTLRGAPPPGTGNGGAEGTGTMPNPAGTPNPPAPPRR